MGGRLHLVNVRVTYGNSFRAIATFGLGKIIDQFLAELCGFEDEVNVEVGIRKETRVKVAGLSKTDLPIVLGLVLGPCLTTYASRELP